MIGEVGGDTESGLEEDRVVRGLWNAGWVWICRIRKIVVNRSTADQKIRVRMEPVDLAFKPDSATKVLSSGVPPPVVNFRRASIDGFANQRVNRVWSAP